MNSPNAPPIDKLISSRRVAFMLGNSAYKSYGMLVNAASDVALIANKFRALGIEVTLHTNLGPGEIQPAFDCFAANLNSEGIVDTAIIYYAGHGFQEEGKNHILSVPDSEGNVKSIAVHYLVGKLRKRSGRRLLFFDACRDYLNIDATADSLARTRSAKRAGIRPTITTGLSDRQVDYGGDTMLSFSAAPGKTALDTIDGSALSPYAAALGDHIDSVGLSLDYVLKRVNADVTERTNGAQVPWTVEALKGPFYFAPSPLLFLTGNLMAFGAVIVAMAMMLCVFMATGAELAVLHQSSAVFPLLALASVLAAFGALMFGFSRAYSRALGTRLDEANAEVEFTPPLHGAVGGLLGGIISAPFFALPYWWTWRQTETFCQQYSWLDPLTHEGCPRLADLLVEIALAGIFISAVLGWSAVFMSNRLRERKTGWTASYSDTTRLLIGATIGGTLAGLIVGPPVTVFFGAKFRPFLEPNFAMGFAVFCISILSFAVVNYSLERFSRKRMIRSLWAALIAPVLAAIPLGAVLSVLYSFGFVDSTLNWAQLGFENKSLPPLQRYGFLAIAGVPYGFIFGIFLGLLIGLAQLLSDPWDQLPILGRKNSN